MRDPENPYERKPNNGPPDPPRLMSEQDLYRWYIQNSSSFRAAHGFGRKDGKLVIVDAEKLRKMPESDLKSILRELYQELK
jgi:hypothetical protein